MEERLSRAREDEQDPDLQTDVHSAVATLAERKADVIVCTRSTLGPLAEQARTAVPVVRVDRPMARAAQRGRAAGAYRDERSKAVANRCGSLDPMRVVLQRASRAQVTVDDHVVGRLPSPGLVALVGITATDTIQIADRMAEKTWGLRILDGETSASEQHAPLLVVSQFTLYASTRKGRRPSWSAAAPGHISKPLVDSYVEALRARGAHVETGVFGAHMHVELVNDGPVTILLDSADWG